MKNNNIDIIDYSEMGIIQELKLTARNMDLSDDLNALTSNQFTIVAKHTGERIFKATGYLIEKGNAYNVNKVMDLLNIYISICTTFNKCISLYGFNGFISISDSYTCDYAGCNGLNQMASRIMEKLKHADNERCKGNATDSKQAILNLAYNNYQHNWNGEIKGNELKATVKTLGDIQRERLETSANGAQNSGFSFEMLQQISDNAVKMP